MRIAVGGIRHETNTFSSLRTGLENFHVSRGPEILEHRWYEEIAPDAEWVGTLMAGAGPHGPVRREAYLALKAELLERLEAALPLDGVYLWLHGAMEVEGVGDGESDLAIAVRERLGPEACIVASLDLHGNIAPGLVAATDLLTALRTAPHRDGESTIRRTLSGLVRCLRSGRRPVQEMVKLPLLLPGEYAVTEIEPARSLYRMVEEIEALPGILDASLLIGCAWTDSPFTSVSAIVVAEEDRNLARREAARLAAAVWDRRREFGPDAETASVDEAVSRAMAAPERPIFLSDSGDNVTAGGAGDIPLIAERLLAAGATGAVVAGLADPEAVRACAAAGAGARVILSVGGKLDRENGVPLRVDGEVVRLVPEAEPGLAVLRCGGVELVLTAGRRAFTTVERFREAGIDPIERRVVVVKQGYLFPELRAIAAGAIMALSPGFTDLRLEGLPYRRIRRPVYPLDGDFPWHPAGPGTD